MKKLYYRIIAASKDENATGEHGDLWLTPANRWCADETRAAEFDGRNQAQNAIKAAPKLVEPEAYEAPILTGGSIVDVAVWSVEHDLYEDKEDAIEAAMKMVRTGVSTWAKDDQDREIIRTLLEHNSWEQVLRFFNLVGESKNERAVNKPIDVSEVYIRPKRTTKDEE